MKEAIWSIGVYEGETIFDLKPAVGIENPVISAGDVEDIGAEFVADPFMIKVGETWHMFFEVMNAETKKGEIGLAVSEDGRLWRYRQIVLKEPFHLSYPYVFFLDGEYYMIPESYKANATRLYRGDPFPDRWSPIESLMEGAWVDSSIIFWADRWWMFATPVLSRSSRLELFYSHSVKGPWERHPATPIIEDDYTIARPAGRVIAQGDSVIRFTQDCDPYYGTRVRAFEISELTTSGYCEQEASRSPILSGGDAKWNQWGMHHIDPHWVGGRWLACVDGWRVESKLPLTGNTGEGQTI